jgi:hypothetical protein
VRKRTNADDNQNITDQPTEFMRPVPTTQPTLLLPENHISAVDDAKPQELRLPRGYGKRFTNVRLLGQGGTGAAYAAFDTELERPVVIKVLHNAPAGLAPKEFARHEARTVANLHHPGIVTLYDCITTKEQAWLVFEYVPGISLEAYIKKKGRLLAAEAVDLCIQMCEAMEYAHRQRIWHLDIKPGNVLVDGKHVKITDFGIGLKSGSQKDNQSWGTPGYAPDEQLTGQPTARSDVYALAAVLWAMLTGSVQEGAFSMKQRKLWRLVPYELKAPLRAALSRRTTDRPRSPGEFAAILRRATEQANGQTSSQRVWHTGLAALFIIGVTGLLAGHYPISMTHDHQAYWLGTLLVALAVIKPAPAVTLSLIILSCAVFRHVPTLGVMLFLTLPVTALLLRYRFRSTALVLLSPFMSAIRLSGLFPLMAGGFAHGLAAVWVAAGSTLFTAALTGLLHTPLVQGYFEAAATALPRATLFRQVLAVILQISPKDMVLTLFPALLRSAVAPPVLWSALIRVVLALLIGYGKEQLVWPISSGVIVIAVLVEAGLRSILGMTVSTVELIMTLLFAAILMEVIPGRVEGNLVSLRSWGRRLMTDLRERRKQSRR